MFGALLSLPADRLGGPVAQILLRSGEQRERLTAGLYRHPGSALDGLELAFELAARAAAPLGESRRATAAAVEVDAFTLEELRGEIAARLDDTEMAAAG